MATATYSPDQLAGDTFRTHAQLAGKHTNTSAQLTVSTGVSNKTSAQPSADQPGLDVSIPISMLKLTKQRTKMYEIIKEMHTSMGRQAGRGHDS